LINDADREAGNKGEILFRQLLDRLRLPFLYIRQKKDQVSVALKNDQGACNPDYQVNLHDLGNPYFDVKVASVCYLNSDKGLEEDKCFPFNNASKDGNGIDQMTAFQRQWLAPVWVAFIDRQLVDSGERGSFYLISLNTILEYHHYLKELLGAKRVDKLPRIFLPLRLMQLVNDGTGFVIKSNVPGRKDIRAWAERYGKGLSGKKTAVGKGKVGTVN
jgi:hypothetical protein